MLTTKTVLSLAVLSQPIFGLPHVIPRQSFENFARLVVFGDSYSDDGDGAWVVSNHTWPSDPAYFGHHFSNGPVWPQDLSGTLGVQLLDYGVGGATADNNFVQGYTGYNSTIPVPSTNDQIKSFLSNDTINTDTDILAIYIGFNDIFFNSSISGASITRIIESQVHTLYAAGAGTILLATYPDPATFPGEVSADAASKSNLTIYNNDLSIGLQTIVTAWSPYIDIGVADIGGLFTKIQTNPADYGVDASYIDPPTACLTGTYPDSGPRELCSDPDRHLFFDIWHPTRRIHVMMASVFAETVQGLFSGGGGRKTRR